MCRPPENTYLEGPTKPKFTLFVPIFRKIVIFIIYNISDQEFETFWPLAILYNNCYTLGLQFLYSYEYVSHEHEYIFQLFIVQLWKLMEASRLSKAIVSGDWNDCQSLIGWMLLTLAFGIHIWSAQQTKNWNSLNCKRNSSPFCSTFCILSCVVY